MSRTSTDAGCLRRISLNGPTMGSRWTAVWYDDGRPDPMPVGRALAAAVGTVDDQMSTWKAASDLMTLNRAPVGRWLDVPASLATVLAMALRIGHASGGAFDIGVGRLVAEWGFGSHAGRPEQLPAATSRLDLDTLEVDEPGRRVRKHAPLSIDLSGIAKGYGVDEMARVLEAAGIHSYLVGIDGEMRAHGCKPDGAPWAIAVERPDPETRASRGILAVEDSAVATSGDYRHTRTIGPQRISHTMDPRSGRPVADTLASVTVLASTAMVADAMATALIVLGPADGLDFARRQGVEVLMLERKSDGSLYEHGTGRFALPPDSDTSRYPPAPVRAA